MKTVALLLLFSFIFVSCDGLDGTFNVNDQLTINYKDKIYEVDQGEYRATLKYKKNKLTIKLKDYDGKDDKKIKMLFPKGTKFPEDNGSFQLSAEELGQSFSIEGEVVTTRVVGESRKAWESCTYTDREYVCYPSGDGHQRCYWRNITRYGHQDVWFHYLYRTRVVEVIFGSSDDITSRFDSTQNKTFKVIEHATRCW